MGIYFKMILGMEKRIYKYEYISPQSFSIIHFLDPSYLKVKLRTTLQSPAFLSLAWQNHSFLEIHFLLHSYFNTNALFFFFLSFNFIIHSCLLMLAPTLLYSKPLLSYMQRSLKYPFWNTCFLLVGGGFFICYFCLFGGFLLTGWLVCLFVFKIVIFKYNTETVQSGLSFYELQACGSDQMGTAVL